MRFCFVNMPIEYYSPTSGGAISTIIAEVARQLVARGHDVTVLTYTDGGRGHEAGRVVDLGAMPRLSGWTAQFDRVSRKLLRRPYVAYEQYRRAVRRRVRDAAPDVLVVFNDYHSPRWLAGRGRIVVTWLQNDQAVPSRVRSDVVLACSDYIAQRARERGVPASRVCVAPSGVDASAFSPRPDWLDPRPLRVLTIGRLDPNKGHDVALDVVAQLQDEGCDISITLAGAEWWYGPGARSPYTVSLLAGIEAANGRFEGLVGRAEVPALFREHDVVLAMSRAQEPFGLVVLEAMASGCAVIASRRGGLPQACGGAAALVDPDDLPAVARALRCLLVHDDLVRAKEAGRERALRAPWSLAAEVLARETAGRQDVASG